MAVAAIPIALAVIGAAASAKAASEKNHAIRGAQRSAQEAANVHAGQLTDAAAVERQKQVNRAAVAEGRLRVHAAESGLNLGGSFGALDQQIAFDEAYNETVILRNRNSQIMGVQSDLYANIGALRAQYKDPIFAAFTGAVGGASTGLSLSGGIGSLSSSTPAAGGTLGNESFLDIGGGGPNGAASYGGSAFA